jgi:hypothetical protein
LSSLYLVAHHCSVLCGVFCLLTKQTKNTTQNTTMMSHTR